MGSVVLEVLNFEEVVVHIFGLRAVFTWLVFTSGLINMLLSILVLAEWVGFVIVKLLVVTLVIWHINFQLLFSTSLCLIMWVLFKCLNTMNWLLSWSLLFLLSWSFLLLLSWGFLLLLSSNSLLLWLFWLLFVVLFGLVIVLFILIHLIFITKSKEIHIVVIEFCKVVSA